MIYYMNNKRTNMTYVLKSAAWPSFCNGELLTFKQVGSDEFKTASRLNTRNSKSRENYKIPCTSLKDVRYNVLAKLKVKRVAYLLMLKSDSDLLTRANNIFTDQWSITSYSTGAEEYALWVLKSRINTYTRKDMRVIRGGAPALKDDWINKLIISLNGNYTNAAVNERINTVVEKATLDDNYILTLDTDNTPVYVYPKTYWGTDYRGNHITSKTDQPSFSLTGALYAYVGPILPSKVKDYNQCLHPIRMLTAMNLATTFIDTGIKNSWGENDYIEIAIMTLLIRKRKLDMFEVFAQGIANILDTGCGAPMLGDGFSYTIKSSILKSKEVAVKSIWLCDNITKCQGADQANDFGTGTFINMLLEANIKGQFSTQLKDGSTIYFKVSSLMAGNTTHGGRNTFVALVSRSPIVETVEGELIEEQEG